MARELKPLDIYIMGREYRIACPETEQHALMQAAQHLDLKMREIREQGKIIGIERIAVMAALNITFEMQNKPSQAVDINHAQRRIEAMEERIDQAMRSQEGLFDEYNSIS